MLENRKLRLVLILLGGLLLLGGWFFLFTSLLQKDSDTLSADVVAGKDQGDDLRLPEQQVGFSEKPNDNPDDKQNAIESDEPEKTEKTISLETPVSKKNYEPITVLVPPHVQAEQLQELRKHIYKTHKVLAHIQIPKTRSTYEELIEEELTTPTIDIILTPSHWIESFDDRGVHIDFNYPITPLFHEGFVSLIENSAATFIPFSLDPYVTIYDKDISLPRSFTIGHIQNLLLEGKYTLPFFISQQRLGLAPYPGYSDLILRFFDDALYQENTYLVDYFLNKHDIDTASFATTIQSLQQDKKRCGAFPLACLLATQEIDIGFARLSLLNQLEVSFDTSIYDQGYEFSHLPVGKEQYPYVGRGRILNKKSEHLEEVGQWIKGYLQIGETSTFQLWPYTFSAFKRIFEQQRLETRYQRLLSYPSSIAILQGNKNDMNVLLEETPLLPMIQGDYDMHIYLKGSYQ